MNDELQEFYHKIDAMSETMKRVEIFMTRMEADFINEKTNNGKNISEVKKCIEEAKEARKVIHKQQDDYESRLRIVESSPVFQEWALIKKQLNTWLWRAIGIFILLLLVRSIPDIITLIEKAVK